jgi:periplasmic protein TonB
MRKMNAKKITYAISLLAVIAGIYLIYIFHAWLVKNSAPEKKVVVQQITLIAPPPPPPPPPPPEPEVEEEVIEDVPETPPESAQEEAPAGQDLGLDADGSAGTDGFGLIGRKGGTGIGIGKAGRYEVMVKENVIDRIYADEELKYLAYSGVITLWVNATGKVEKYSIDLDEDAPKIKKLLESVLTTLTFDSGPPIETADKGIKLRVNSRI